MTPCNGGSASVAPCNGRSASVAPHHSPARLAEALGLPVPTDEQAAVIAAPPGPMVVIAGAGAGKTETMAARVVWLVANGYAEPGQVLGLTFTRKAAGQLMRRVRSRLARLAGAGEGDAPADAEPATVSTYHAFAGALLRDHGLLLPMEPNTRLLSETELWQLAFRVVCDYPGDLDTDKNPATVASMVLRLSSALAEHLVDTAQLRDTHVELERLVTTLPAGPYQRERGPSQWLRRLLAVQHERTQLVPLVDALHARMREDNVMDFGQQMAQAARLAVTHPEVGEQLRARYRVSPPISASPTEVPRPPSSCVPAGEIRRRLCIWRTRCPRRRAAGRWRCARCGHGQVRRPAPSGALWSATCATNGSGWPSISPCAITKRKVLGHSRRPQPYWSGATPTRPRWPKQSPRWVCRLRSSGWPDCSR
jgi:hypothetical protein